MKRYYAFVSYFTVTLFCLTGCKFVAVGDEAKLKEVIVTPKDAPVYSEHAVCRVRATPSLHKVGSSNSKGESDYLMAYAFDFEAEDSSARIALARARMEQTLVALQRDGLKAIKKVDDAVLGTTFVSESCEIETANDAFAIECDEVVAPQVLVLNQALMNPFEKANTSETNFCGNAQNALRRVVLDTKFPLPDVLYCYLVVDKTRQHIDGEVTHHDDSALSSHFKASSTSRHGHSSGHSGNWFRQRSYSSSSSSHSSASSANLNYRRDTNFSFRINTTYLTSSSIVIERAFVTEGYENHRHNLISDAYQALLTAYQPGNAPNDVVATTAYCLSQRVPVPDQAKFIANLETFPF